MNEENRCPECGAELAANAPRGLCPACLLKGGLGTATGPSGGATRSAAVDYARPVPAESAPYFPDLEILELVGRGGMGVVYKARQKHLDRLVALKILSPKIGHDPAFAERFAREARAMAMLSHPHIVAVYDFGQAISPLPPGEGPGVRAEGQGEGLSVSPLPFAGEVSGVRGGSSAPLYYFLMEFVDGLNLRKVLDAGKLTPQEALAIVPQICEALQYAHDHGVVHRDIKPENVLLNKEGRVKIADFGLAKLLGQPAKDFTLTGEGQVMGTPQYMAPEQIEHPLEVDHRADIYSLGVVFYQMLTGELPIGRFAPPSKKVEIDVRLDEVVLRALEKEPGRRYQQASEIKTRVETIVTTPSQMGAAGAADVPPTGHARTTWRAWLSGGPLRSPEVAEIYAHMTDAERLADNLRNATMALLFIVSLLIAGIAISSSSLNQEILGGVIYLSVFLMVREWPKMRKQFLCSTAWARQQGFTPARLRLSIFFPSVDGPRTSASSEVPRSAAAPPPDAVEDVRRQVQGPAIGLLATGILNWVLSVPLSMMILYMAAHDSPPSIGGIHLNTWASLSLSLMIVCMLAILILSSLVIFAALKMKRLQAYGLTIAASILAIIISPGNLIGLPIGIWAIVVLSQRDVRGAFGPIIRPAVSRRQRTLGGVALLVCLASPPVFYLFLHSVPSGSLSANFMFLLPALEAVALILGILGRRSFAGKFTLVLISIVILVLGPFVGLRWISQVRHDFGGMPSISDLRSASTPQILPVDNDSLSGLQGTTCGLGLRPVDAAGKASVVVLDLGLQSQASSSWPLSKAEYGLPTDATPEQLAAKAEKGDLFLTLSEKAKDASASARFVPLRGATLFPLALPPEQPSGAWTHVERLRQMTRRQIAALGDAYLDAHPITERQAITVSEGQVYTLVRSNSDTFVLIIGELTQNAGGSNRTLEISTIFIGKIPWGMNVRVVDTHGTAVPDAAATFSVTERVKKTDGLATYETRRLPTVYSDAEGGVQLPRLAPGARLWGEVAAPGFFPRHDLAASRGADGNYYPPGDDGVVQLKRPGAIEGQVIGPDGKPVPHISLSLDTTVVYPKSSYCTGNHFSGLTDERGQFRIEGVPPGHQRIYHPWSGSQGGPRSFGPKETAALAGSLPLANYGLVTPVTVEENATAHAVLDFSHSTSAVEGKVLGVAGRPAAGASVAVLWAKGNESGWMQLTLPNSVADASGHYRVDHLPPGAFRLQAIPPGMKVVPGDSWAGSDVELVAGQVLNKELRLTSAETSGADSVGEAGAGEARSGPAPTEGPLKVSPLPAGWKLKYDGTNGIDFYTVTPKEEGSGVMMASRWPSPSKPEDIPALLRQIADGFVKSMKKDHATVLASEKYDVEQFAGDHCKGSYAVFTLGNGGVQAMFMMSVDGQIWNGQFTGHPDDWRKALNLLKCLTRKHLLQPGPATPAPAVKTHVVPAPAPPSGAKDQGKKPGPVLTYEVDPLYGGPGGIPANSISVYNMERLVKIVDNRLNSGSKKLARVTRLDGGRVEVALLRQDEDDRRHVERLLARCGMLEFHILANDRHDKTLIERARKESYPYIIDNNGKGLAWWVPVREKDEKSFAGLADVVQRTRKQGTRQVTEILVVGDPYKVNSYCLTRAEAAEDHGRPCINFALNSAGGKLFAKLTGEYLPDKAGNFKYRLGIILDDELCLAPYIIAAISDRGQITGNFSKEEAADLAEILSSGSLPERLRLVREPIVPQPTPGPGSLIQRLRRFDAGISVRTIACSGDGKLIAVGNDQPSIIFMGERRSKVVGNWRPAVKIFDVATGQAVAAPTLSGKDEDAVLAATERVSHFQVTALAFSPDGNVLAVGTSIGQVKLLGARTGKLVRSLDDEKAKLADKKTPEKWKSLTRAMGSVASLAFSPDGSLLATCGEAFDDFSDSISGVDTMGVRGTGPGRLKVWDVKTGALRHDLAGHSDASAVAWSPDGNLLASAGSWWDFTGDLPFFHGSGTGLILWNAHTGAEISTITIPFNGRAYSVAFSPDSKLAAVGTQCFLDKKGFRDASSGAVSLAQISSEMMEWQQSVAGFAQTVAFLPNGKSIAVLCGGQSVRFLDIQTGNVKQEIRSADPPQDGRWSDFALAPRGHVLAIGGVDAEKHGFVELWRLGKPATNARSAPPAVGAVAELKLLQGPWKVVRIEKGADAAGAWATICQYGSSLDPATTTRLDFCGPDDPLVVIRGGLPIKPSGKESSEVTGWPTNMLPWHAQDFDYSFDPTASPKRIDLLGGGGERIALGIYEIVDGQLKIRLVSPLARLPEEAQRPKSFSIEPNSSDVLFVLERYGAGEEKKLEGAWAVVAETTDGVAVAEKDRRIVEWSFVGVRGNPGLGWIPNRAWQVPIFVLDTTREPKRIAIPTIMGAMVVRDDQAVHSRYSMQDAIYKLEGDRLAIAYRQSGPVPEKFESKPGSGVTLLEFKKAKPQPGALKADLTQDKTAEIRRDGSIQGKVTITQRYNGDEPLRTLQFVNSDFVHVEKMYDAQGRALKFNVEHSGKHFNYTVPLPQAVPPGGELRYTIEATESGLVKPVVGQAGLWRYYMRHWPASGVRTRRIEHFVLPPGAQLVEKSPADLRSLDHEGRTELFIDRLIPGGDSLEVSFQYRLPQPPPDAKKEKP